MGTILHGCTVDGASVREDRGTTADGKTTLVRDRQQASARPDRVARNMASCGCRLMLGDRALLDALAAAWPGCDTGGRPVPQIVDLVSVPWAADGAAPAARGADGTSLANLLFTSGSTGTPKSVEVVHRNVPGLLRSASEMLRFGPDDRDIASSVVSLDASITELFQPLVIRGRPVLRGREIRLDPNRSPPTSGRMASRSSRPGRRSGRCCCRRCRTSR